MHLVALKVVDKKVKDHLLKEKAIILLLVVKIILLVEKHLLADNKTKKIVRITQLRLDVNLDKKVKDRLLREKVIILLLVVKKDLMVVKKDLMVVKVKDLNLVDLNLVDLNLVDLNLVDLNHLLRDYS